VLSFFRLTEVARCLARTCSLSRWCTSDIGELLLCSGYFPFVFFINHRCVVGGPDILLLASTAEPSWATTHPATAVLLLLPLQVLPQQVGGVLLQCNCCAVVHSTLANYVNTYCGTTLSKRSLHFRRVIGHERCGGFSLRNLMVRYNCSCTRYNCSCTRYSYVLLIVQQETMTTLLPGYLRREGIVMRTHDGHKNPYIPLFLRTILGPHHYVQLYCLPGYARCETPSTDETDLFVYLIVSYRQNMSFHGVSPE